MKPKRVSKSTNLLQQENLRLKRTSFEVYLRLLSKLLQSQSDKSFLKGLSDALRRRDFKDLMMQSDLLSSTKYEDATDHFVANQFSLLIRKYPWDSALIGADPLARARASFENAEMRNKRINRKFELLRIDPSRDKFRKEGKEMMSWCRTLIGSKPSYSSVFRESDFGRGASVGVHGDDTHLIRKLSSQRWTVTPGAIHHGYASIMQNAHFHEVLLPRGGDHGLICYDNTISFDNYVSRMNVIGYNKLSFVPKTAKTHRVIAVEPLLNGLVQKGIDQVLRKKLRARRLDLSDQSRNQEMARLGSISDTDESFVTLDLANASNSVSLEVVRTIFPPDWFELFARTRSPQYMIDGVCKDYNMLCSMGNGFCFPVQVILFSSICHACGCGVPAEDFIVYGDDIIVRKKYAARVIELLRHYGFRLNTDKSFVEGPFRESCGSDWFGGQDVRPFTLDFELDSVQNVFKICNLTQRNERTKTFFSPVRSFLTSIVSSHFRFFRPLTGTVDSGIDSLGDEHLTCPNCVYKDGVWSWKVLVHTPVEDLSAIRSVQNEPWLMGVALRGSKSNLQGLPSVSFRRKTKTRVARESYSATSNWLPTY